MERAENDVADTAISRSLTTVVARLRRTLRTSIRSDFPWETLPMAQIELLMAVQDHQPARVGQLATVLQLAQSTVSGLLQQLVDAGFVERVTHVSDRRAAQVTITGAGRAMLDDWDHAHERRIASALARLPLSEQQFITDAMPALVHLVDELAAG